MSQTVQFNPSYLEVTVSYTGTTADISVGDLVCATGANDTDGVPAVVRPATAHLMKCKYLVTSFAPNVNEIVSGSTRRGGLIKAIDLNTASGNFTMNCAANSPNTYVGVADGSFLATTISDSSNDTIVEQARYIGFQMTDLSGGAGSGTVHVGGF